MNTMNTNKKKLLHGGYEKIKLPEQHAIQNRIDNTSEMMNGTQLQKQQLPQPQQQPPQPQQQPQPGASDYSTITPDMLEQLKVQGFSINDIAQMIQESGQTIPPIIQAELAKQGVSTGTGPVTEKNVKLPDLNKYPAMMDMGEYKKYKKDEEFVKKNRPIKRAATYGYMFSDLLREDIMREMKRTQGSFLVGVNLSNLFNEFRKMVLDNNDNNNKDKDNTAKNTIKSPTAKSDKIFKKVGEYVDVSYDDILEKNLGFRDGNNISRLPEVHLDRTSTFDQIIDESKAFADAGYKGEITPVGLLMMTRMLYKYKTNNAQWIRVATVLELIYKYLGGTQTRQSFFKDKHEIPILSLMDLEEFYNTDHIFMTHTEIEQFKKNLEFYKTDILSQITSKISTAKLKLQKNIT